MNAITNKEIKELVATPVDTSDVIGGIVSSSVLIDLNISMWTARKTDKGSTKKVIADNGAKANDAALVTKRLFVDNPKLEAIGTAAGAARHYVAENSLPWMGNLKMVPLANLQKFTDDLNEYKSQFDKAVVDFLSDYGLQINAMAFKLGNLFKRDEYPTMMEISPKFAMNWTVMPLPATDFRVQAEQQLRDELKERYEQAMQDRLTEAMGTLWERLRECLARMADRLGYREDGKPNIFRDSLVTNALELVELLRVLNVTGDENLERARKSLEKAMLGIDPGTLRDSPEVRESLQKKVQGIMDKFSL